MLTFAHFVLVATALYYVEQRWPMGFWRRAWRDVPLGVALWALLDLAG